MNQDFFKRLESNGVYLNDVQKRAVLITEGPILLLASPGSGKTTTLISKIGYLIEEKEVDPQKILAVTFSRASAADMKERFAKLFPHIPDHIHFSTIHSFAFQVVREHFNRHHVAYQLIEGDEERESTKKLTTKKGGVPIHKKMILKKLFQDITGEPITEDQMEELLNYISYVKNKLLEERELEKVKTNLPYAKEIYLGYEKFKHGDSELVFLDYDDMLTVSNQILEENEEVLEAYQHRFSYILTDESQDTSLVQHKIIEKLAKVHRNICVVADDDQTIYSWRGAEPEYLLKFRDVYPEATILYMEQNYRSTKDIVETANLFIKRNKHRYNKNMFTNNGYGDPIVIKNMKTYDDQIEYLVDEIKKVENLSEVAVLYRNNASSINVIDALDREGIPFCVKDTDYKFFRHWVVEDILNFMRFSYSDKRVDILEKIYTKFRAYITKDQMDYLKSLDNQESVFDNLMRMTEIKSRQLRALAKCKDIFPMLKTLPPKEAIQVVRDVLGYEKVIERIADRLGFSRDYLLGILNTLERIAEKQETLPDFANRLKHLEVVIAKSKSNKNKNAVTLSTLHSSKGLEFERVYMIDLVNGIIPPHEDIEEYKNKHIEKMEESARLFYVGMTRAKRHLELLAYQTKDKALMEESLFVQDMRNIIPLHRRSFVTEVKTTDETVRKFQVGDYVKHVAFGTGQVEKVDKDTIGIRFQSVGFKTLSISVCLQKNLLQKSVNGNKKERD